MFKPLLSRLMITVLVSGLFVHPVAAASTSVSANSPQSIVNAIQDMGYKADVTIDSYGDPQIRSAAHGVGFVMNFYGCTEGQECTDLQFSVAFDYPNGMDLLSMNSWNIEKVMGNAFLDAVNDPVLQHFMIQVDGMSRGTFDATFVFWVDAMGEFIEYIGW